MFMHQFCSVDHKR